MAFWGVEVKPGKPITHSCEKARGRRLRISQATLGLGEASKKTVVQCNVGNRRPVLLCALLPNTTESCHLDFEFEEADDVVFSVIGPQSVYLAGYYVCRDQQSNAHSDTESYGVDIENTQTDGSSYRSDEDMYDDSFINDDDDEKKVSPESPVLSSKGLDEITLENDEPKGKKGHRKQLKKKNQVIVSDNDAKSHENEDEEQKGRGKQFKKKNQVIESDDDANSHENEDEEGKRGHDKQPKKKNQVIESDNDANSHEKEDEEGKRGNRNQLKKKNQVIESDNDANSYENEDEDGFLSLFKSNRPVKTTVFDSREKITNENEDEEQEKGHGKQFKKKNQVNHGKQFKKKNQVIESDDDANWHENEDEEREKGHGKQSKKKNQVIESDDGADLHENEDEEREKGHGKQLKKKNQVIESDNDANSYESEDEDGSLSLFKSNRPVKTTVFDSGEKITSENEDEEQEKGHGKQFKKKNQVIESDDDANSHENEDEEREKGHDKQRKKKNHVIESDDDGNSHENKDEEGERGRGKQLKKNHMIESDNEATSHESEDEDGSLSLFNSNRTVKTTVFESGEKIAQVTEEMEDDAKEDGVYDSESKQNGDPLNINGNVEREKILSLDEEKTEADEEKNELFKEVEALEKITVPNQDVIHGTNTKETSIVQNLFVSDGKDQSESLDLVMPKKKRKERSVKEKNSKVQTDKEVYSFPSKDNEHQVEASSKLGIVENYLVTPPEVGSLSGQKSKRRRKELQLEGLLTEGTDVTCQNIPEDISEQCLLHTIADIMTKDLPAASGEYEDQRRSEETSTGGIEAKCNNRTRLDEVMQEPLGMAKDVPAANGENQEQQVDNDINIQYVVPSNDKQLDKKVKKRKKKTQGKRDLNVGMIEMTNTQETTCMKCEDQSSNTPPLQKRTLSNGLIIEELANGPTNGKVAAPGKKLKLHYTGMIKENGHVFDSTLGNAACRFRLGDEEFIDGWNFGIDGMRVGDKRRLIIPPSMGFGDQETKDVPPNSWLIYDIELLSVRK